MMNIYLFVIWRSSPLSR